MWSSIDVQDCGIFLISIQISRCVHHAIHGIPRHTCVLKQLRRLPQFNICSNNVSQPVFLSKQHEVTSLDLVCYSITHPYDVHFTSMTLLVGDRKGNQPAETLLLSLKVSLLGDMPVQQRCSAVIGYTIHSLGCQVPI